MPSGGTSYRSPKRRLSPTARPTALRSAVRATGSAGTIIGRHRDISGNKKSAISKREMPPDRGCTPPRLPSPAYTRLYVGMHQPTAQLLASGSIHLKERERCKSKEATRRLANAPRESPYGVAGTGRRQRGQATEAAALPNKHPTVQRR